MATYEVEINGTTFEVDAADEQSAAMAAHQIAQTAPPKTKPKKAEGPLEHGVRMVDGAVRGAADFLSFGFADEAAAAGDALVGSMTGKPGSFSDRYQQNLAGEHAQDESDRKNFPVSRGVGQAAGFAGSMGAGMVMNAGRLVPRLAPRATGLVRGAESVARNVVAGAGAGAAGGAGSSQPGQRLEGAGTGAVVGAVAGLAAPAVGHAVSGGVRAVGRALGRGQPSMTRRGAEGLASQMGDQLDPAALRARQAEILANGGAQPTMTDLMPQSGLGVVRAAASRQTPGREAAVNFARGRRAALPDRLSQQARRTMSPDPRTPDRMRTDIGQRRSAQADVEYGAVRDDRFALPQETVEALRSGHAHEAIKEAFRRERDPNVRAELARLADAVLDNPGGTEITVGMADRITRVLFGKARAAAQSGDNDLAAVLTRIGEDIRQPARTAVPGYGDAIDNYAAESRLQGAAETGEQFMDRNTDEFVDAVGNMGPEELAVARAAGRRAIERKSGESLGSAPGVADKLALAPEQQARNRALLGNQGAEQLQRGVATERDMYDRAQFVSPNTGSQTQPRGADAAQMAGKGIELAQAVGSGNPVSVVSTVLNWMKSGGLDDRTAQALVELSVDPARTAEAIRLLETRGVGLTEARTIVEGVRTALARSGGESVQPRPQIEVTGETNPEYQAWLAQQGR